MRILYIDVDSCRPDHLGCYGYHRDTSPNIDRIASQGVRYNNYHATDVPCLPSRTALFAGRFGYHTGVINHGGVQADMFNEGVGRGFGSTLGNTSWMRCLRRAGYHTACISPFGERHSAWHWYANFSEIHNTGGFGGELAEKVSPIAIDWINRKGADDNWFMHLNVWDPHTPYRTPAAYGDPFKDQPIPSWYTEAVRADHWMRPGPHSARECRGYDADPKNNAGHPRQQVDVSDMDHARMMFDGYDTGVRYADEHLGRIFNALADQGVLDDTAIIISADHGENLGELNIYGDHQTADEITSRVPLIIRWPGVTDDHAGRVDNALHYHFDMAASVIELAGQDVPDNWDGVSFAESIRTGQDAGRDYLVVSNGAWTCQRAVRFNHRSTPYICIRSYHDGYHGFPDIMLFDLKADPHEQHNLAVERQDLVNHAMSLLDDWRGEMMATATTPQDPMEVVIREGGPFHTRGKLPKYLDRLRATDREPWAARLAAKHPKECV